MPNEGEDKGFWPDWMTPRRAWNFIKNVATLEQSVETLKADNKEIRLELFARSTAADRAERSDRAAQCVRAGFACGSAGRQDRAAGG